jgi:hypothetical protein
VDSPVAADCVAQPASTALSEHSEDSGVNARGPVYTDLRSLRPCVAPIASYSGTVPALWATLLVSCRIFQEADRAIDFQGATDGGAPMQKAGGALTRRSPPRPDV